MTLQLVTDWASTEDGLVQAATQISAHTGAYRRIPIEEACPAGIAGTLDTFDQRHHHEPVSNVMTRRSLLGVGVFLGLWLAVGFAAGTGTLLGPVRWATTYSRLHGLGTAAENRIVWAIVIVLLAGSFGAALWLTRLVRRSRRREIRFGIPLLALAAAAGSLWLWLTPAALEVSMGATSSAGPSFTFGPYPTAERMRRLKEEGYTAVISLLHPAVIPFEPKLLADEKQAAAREGLELIHIPLLPWISDNTKELERIKEIAGRPSGRYYVHCYLGMDRVQVVKRIVEQAGSQARTEALSHARDLRDVKVFERGSIVALGDGRYLLPYPTDEEWMGFILAGNVRQVVSLLDPQNPEDLPRIEHERGLLSRYELPFELMPLSLSPYDPFKVLEAARRIRTLPAPLVVHAFFTPPSGQAALAEALLQAFQTDRPPLPPSLFENHPLARGEAKVIAPHIACGPRPEESEFEAGLYARGVRGILFLGDPDSASAREDRTRAEKAGLTFRAESAVSPDLLGILAKGGPWYVYGPSPGAIEREIERHFGPAIPEKVIGRSVPKS